ncbi:MAG TPA: single-stranded DNA-binding protein [Armatimonadota bacterium]|nr:single-stranded DNA-binding protein [Armatimonadota bacterium]HQK96145.1 single-stranded DNA-binding protein [Armatimonadota bacterium]
MINRVVLVGRLGNDPELRVTASGISVCSLRLAVRRPRAQEGQPDTDWIDVVAWRQNAEFVANYLKKGYLVGVDGRLQVREWENQAGEKRRSVEVVADSIQNLQPKERSGDEPPPRRGAEAPGPARGTERAAAPSAIEEDMREAFGDDDGGFDPFADA